MKIDTALLFKSLITALIAFVAPIQWLIVGVATLIIFDTLTGIARARSQKEPITSKRFSHIVSKFALYNIAIISAYTLQLMIGIDMLPLAKIVSVAIGMTELKSVFENINLITGIDLWTLIINQLKRNTDDLSKSAVASVKEDNKDA